MNLLSLFEWLGDVLVLLVGWGGGGGGVLVINLRVLGLGLRSEPAGRLVKELGPYLTGCLAAMVCSGVMLVAAEPEKCYYNAAFRVKMGLLAGAVLFTVLVQRRRVEWRSLAVISMLLWLGVGLAGRAIG
jgi:hypothetical protein